MSPSLARSDAGDDHGQQRDRDPDHEEAELGPPRRAPLPEDPLALHQLHGRETTRRVGRGAHAPRRSSRRIRFAASRTAHARSRAHEQRRPDDHVPRAGGPALPAAPGVRRPGERHGRALRAAAADPEAFWLEQAKELLTWSREPTEAFDRSNPPFFTWFADGTLNASVNCLDRHLESRGDQVAFHWEGEPAASRWRSRTATSTSASASCRTACARAASRGRPGGDLPGHGPGDRGRDARLRAHRRAAHGRVRRLLARQRCATAILDCGCTALITADGGWRGGKLVPLKQNADAALERAPDVTPGGRAAHRERDRLGRGPGRLVPRAGRGPARRGRARAAWTPSTRSTSSTRRARPGSRRASCTPPAAT